MLVVCGRENVELFAVGRCADASEVDERVGDGVGHERFVACVFDLLEELRVVLCEFLGAIEPEGYVELIVCQFVIDDCLVVATEEFPVALVTFLAVVGHIDDHRILTFEPAADEVNDGIVVERSIVVVGEDVELPICEIVADVFVGLACELAAVVGCSLRVVDVLSHEVENGEAGSAVGCNGIVVVE